MSYCIIRLKETLSRNDNRNTHICTVLSREKYFIVLLLKVQSEKKNICKGTSREKYLDLWRQLPIWDRLSVCCNFVLSFRMQAKRTLSTYFNFWNLYVYVSLLRLFKDTFSEGKYIIFNLSQTRRPKEKKFLKFPFFEGKILNFFSPQKKTFHRAD